jgi:hypothetical protein
MSVSLSNDDRCAVDLLLEHAPPSSQGACFSQGPSSTMQERLTRIEALLHLLDLHVMPEPAPDLAARTTSRCLGGASAVRAVGPDQSQSIATAS